MLCAVCCSLTLSIEQTHRRYNFIIQKTIKNTEIYVYIYVSEEKQFVKIKKQEVKTVYIYLSV